MPPPKRTARNPFQAKPPVKPTRSSARLIQEKQSEEETQEEAGNHIAAIPVLQHRKRRKLDETIKEIPQLPRSPAGNRNETDKVPEVLKSTSDKIILEDGQLQGSNTQTLPTDWTIKSTIKFTGLSDFSWVRCPKFADGAAGVAEFVRGSVVTEDTNEVSVNSRLHRSFQRAIMYYVYPACPQTLGLAKYHADLKTKPQAQLTKEQKADLDVHNNMQREWVDGLKCLYRSLRAGYAPYFYVVAKDFTVLFTGFGVRNSNSLSAVMSSSTRSLRTVLREEDIPFEQFKDSSNLAPDEEEDKVEEELVRLQEKLGRAAGFQAARSRTKSQSDTDNALHSALLFQGHNGVHGLFEFLLNKKFLKRWSTVFPTLYASTAFQNGTLKSLSVKSCRPVNAKLSLRRSAPVQKGYELELQGPILPLSFYNLVQLMTGSQPKYFEVNMPKPSKEEFSLNVCKACDPELVQSTSKTSLSHGATVFLAAQTMGYRVLSRIVSTQGLLSFSY
eukprot:m.46483 g.46483  ORF g.46483 m.46483 type:complete len:501 (+) comp10377_c0_seq2:131-1633(+)